MTVRVNKPAFNLREKLSELEKPIGLKGSELAKAETVQDARDLISAGRRNMIINGDMKVSQRFGDGYSANFSTSGGNYIVDRFSGYNTAGTARGVQSTIAPPGFTYSCKFDITGADTPRTATAYAGLYYQIEGYDASALKWNTPSEAKSCTVSFWVRASVAGTYSLGLRDAAFAQHYVKPYNINQADTWEYKTINVPPPSSGTFNINTSIGFTLFWGIDIDDAASGVTANPGQWGAGNDYGVSGMAHLFSTVGNAFYLTGVQCEVGKNATDFEYRPMGEELALCQRYYFKLTVYVWTYSLLGTSGSYNRATIWHPVEMRAAPTVSFTVSNSGTASGTQGGNPKTSIIYVNSPGNITSVEAGSSFSAELS